MKRNHILALLGATLLLGSAAAPTLSAKSPKRGVSEDSFQYKAQIKALEPGVSWYYNWRPAPGTSVVDCEELEYVPMAWNGGFNADAIREYCKSHPSTQYLLGFNEPNFTQQANMTPAEAAEDWTALRALANELGLKLVAPALNYSPNPPYTDPMRWMDEFVALVGLDAFDYLALHNYGGLGVMKDLCTKFHDKYGKDIWVTEFCYWPEEGNSNSTVAPSSQISSMVETVEWLEKTDWIFRYAWFKPIGNSSASKGPNYGLLIGGRGEDERELSEQGYVYLYMSEFDADKWNAVGDIIPATEYISQQYCTLGRTAGDPSEGHHPIEIASFTAGAMLDYQFNVEEAGNYYLHLFVSGKGEPERFNPAIAVKTVNSDGTDGTTLASLEDFALPGSDSEYKSISFPVTLPAGKQTLRLRDLHPYTPSGIRIQSVQLSKDATFSSVELTPASESADQLIDVYNLQGERLRRNVSRAEALVGLPAGIYIAGNKKIIKR